MYKILYLPTAEEVETPSWLINTKEAYCDFLDDPEIRFAIVKYSSLREDSFSRKLKWIAVSPMQSYIRWGTEIEKYLLEVVEVP
jgi:hypothetical protein